MGEIAVSVVQTSLECIEARLTAPLTVQALAQTSGYSLWHFQRLFQAVVGETVGSYIRKRRLSDSSRRLLRSNDRIVDVALDYQFQSHEAYTRAFKRQFSVSPGEYRRLGQDESTSPANPRDIDITHLDRFLQPEILVDHVFRMVGVAGRFHQIRSDRYDGRDIAGLWEAFFKLEDTVTDADQDTHIGVVIPLTPHQQIDETEADYVAGVQVASATGNPSHFKQIELPPRQYAMFEHHGPMKNLRQTIDSVFAVWFVENANYSVSHADHVEIYTERFHPARDDSAFNIAVPIQKKC